MDDYPHPEVKTKKRIGVWVLVAVVLVVVLGIVALGSYSGLLGARFAPGLAFNITGPDELVAGFPAIVTWDTSPESQQKYPSEKIEYCQGGLFGDRCVTLNSDTTNDGEALVFVPASATKSGYLRLTARNRPGGDLLPSISSTRRIKIVAGDSSQQSAVTPVNVGGGAISTLTAAGPRVPVEAGTTVTVVLPEPSKTKKIEICKHGGRCYTLASSASGSSAQVRIPTIGTGSAFLKVSERGANGILTGRVFFRRALTLVVARPQPTLRPTLSPPQEQSGGDSDGDDSGGGGGSSDGENNNEQETTILCAYSDQDGFWNFHNVINVVPGQTQEIGVTLVRKDGTPVGNKQVRFGAPENGTVSTTSANTTESGVALTTYTPPATAVLGDTDSYTATWPGDSSFAPSSCTVAIKFTPTSTPTVTPTPTGAQASFIVPVDGEQIGNSGSVDVRVLLTETTSGGITCPVWTLNGEILTDTDWTGNQSPALSDGLCDPPPPYGTIN
ncbi:hypothetical protein CL628_01150 [bacterium]|nr:hypothetical protein [bacterium]